MQIAKRPTATLQIRLYVKSQDPFKMSFKLKLCSFASVPSLFKKESTFLIISVFNDLL